MKTLKLICLLFFLFQFFSSTTSAQSVYFKMKRPPLNQLSVSDFYNIEMRNTSNERVEFYLYGTLTESKAGLIATATTAPIVLGPKEVKQFKASDLPKTPDISYPNSDNRYKEALMRKGSLPDGNYTICITGKQTGTNDEIGNDCIEQEIAIKSEMEITLLTPENKTKIESTEPITFTWLPVRGGTTNNAGTYKIKIVEIKGDESPENAMLKNRAFFEKEGIKQTMFQYPSSAPKFVAGKKYAWVIISEGVTSPVSIFDRWGNLLTTTSPKNGEMVNGDSIIFKWEFNNGVTTQTSGTYKIKIIEIKGDESPENALRSRKAFFEKEGIRQTMFQYPSSAPKFVVGNKYAWSISNGDLQSDGPMFQVAGVLSGTVSGPAGPIAGATITLVSPSNGETVNGDSIMFKWESTINNPGTWNGSYKIKIVEIKGDESPENALRFGKAFFEKEGIRIQMLQYPSSAPKFVVGNKYAWQVSGVINKTLDVIASLGVFEINATGTITNNGTINDLKAPTGGDSIMSSKVRFYMKRPPLNQLRIEDLFNGTFTNDGEPTTLYLYGSMTNNENGESTDGSLKSNENGELIATFGPISLRVRKAATPIMEYISNTPDINLLSKDPKYNTFMNKGEAPEGNYKVCIELRDANNNVVALDCFNQKITDRK